MNKEPPKVITIPANPKLQESVAGKRQLRVAAYCRVSTEEEEQLSSYEAQKAYYTDLIMSNKEWTMAGIFADEGITGTSARKRPEFLRMIRQCKQKKIDLILTKSISRFSRNTVDCLNYIRALRTLGVAVIFEKENINTLKAESEIMITLLGAFAQAESESISANVRWGIRQAMREGRVRMYYEKLYAFDMSKDGELIIVPEQAVVVKDIYRQFLLGASLREIKRKLENEQVPNKAGEIHWTIETIRKILSNEKYCGDVLMQKTFITDCISKKVVKNTGQLPMYLIQNHHEAIVDRQTFDAAQAEFSRRTKRKSPSQKTISGIAKYAPKYALSERLVCGECGTLYRRCTWSKKGKKRILWRCVSRLDYGTRYCHNSPSMDEKLLQDAILKAINSEMSRKNVLIDRIIDGMKHKSWPIIRPQSSIEEIDSRLEELHQLMKELVTKVAVDGVEAYASQLKEATDEAAELKNKRVCLELQQKDDAVEQQRIRNVKEVLAYASPEITAWDEALIRQLVETVTVLSEHKIRVHLRGDIVIEQTIEERTSGYI